jgi:hypothetical protein
MSLFAKKQRLRDWEFVSALMNEHTKHLLLGISGIGMLEFLAHEDVRFIVPKGNGDGADFENATAWKYNAELLRGEDGYALLVAGYVAGAITLDDVHGLGNMQGYDLQQFLASWLRRKGHADKSVLEVIEADDRFENLRKHVGPAFVFWSHIQLEDALLTTFSGIFEEEGRGRISALNNISVQTYWLDYFCLRQCQQDFDLHVVLGLVRKIGTLVAAIDPDLVYVSRSFCILEAYAACAWGETNFICHTTGSCADVFEKKLAEQKIDSKAAQTRSPKDKAKIDELITNGSYLYDPISFSAIDKELTERLQEAVRRDDGGGEEGRSGDDCEEQVVVAIEAKAY